MNKSREVLVDRMIAIYGFEHPLTVQYATLCEEYPQGDMYDKCLLSVVEAHEKQPYREEI